MKQILTYLFATMLLFSFSTQIKAAEIPCSACKTISEAKVTNITTTSATLNWNKVTDAKSYDVTVSQANPIPIVPIIFEFKNITTTTLNVPNLVAGTTYTYSVKTNCIDGAASDNSKLYEFKTLASSTGNAGCGVVTQFDALVLDSTTALIKWQPVPGAVSYIVTVTGNGITQTINSTAPAATATKLPGAGNYTYTIVTVCANSKSDASKKGEFTIKTSPSTGTGCGVVTDFGAAQLDSTSASIKWNAVPNAISYEITVTGANGFTATYTSTIPTVVASKLPGYGAYTYSIRAICKDGAGAWSKKGEFLIKKSSIPTNTGCGQVANIKVQTSNDSTKVNIFWTPIPAAVAYEIVVTGPNGFTATYKSTTTTVLADKLPGSGVYTVKVRAICKSGEGVWSKLADFKIGKKITPNPTGCGGVTAVKAEATDSTTAKIVWLPTLNAISYEINITGSNGFSLNLTSTTSPFTVPNLPKNSTFTVKVRAICTSGTSEWSKAIVFKTGKGFTPTTTSCGTPVGLTSKIYNTTTAQLNWSAVPNAISYEIELSELTLTANAPVVTILTSKINTIIIDNLKAGATYKFRVRSICSSSKGDWSKYATFTLKTKLTDPNAGNNATSNSNDNELIAAIYPNPTSIGEVNVTINGKEGVARLSILNMLGSTVKTQDVNVGTANNIDLSDLNAGYYFIKVQLGTQVSTKRLMIARP